MKRFQKKTLFIGDVSINWATGRRWQAKLLDTWQVTQVNNLPRQESVKTLISNSNGTGIGTITSLKDRFRGEATHK